MLDDILLTMYDGEKMKSNYYDITTARGGKDDSAIESSLINKIDALKAGTNVEIRLSRTSPWKAEEDVDIQNRYIVFLDGQDHTFSPVAIKATVRVLHKYGFRGLFWIKVTRDIITIQPKSFIKERNLTIKESPIRIYHPLEKIDDEALWKLAMANPVRLFSTLKDDPHVALFDDKGFFFSIEAEKIYQKIKSKPHIYVARFKSNDAIYIGISNQQGGRWKRSHAYHLGGLAHEILKTTRYDDQNHNRWVNSWFEIENFQKVRTYSKYHIRMRKEAFISFYVPEPPATKNNIDKAESRLVSIARGKGLNVLNILK